MGRAAVTLDGAKLSSVAGFGLWVKHRSIARVRDCSFGEAVRTAIACFNDARVAVADSTIDGAGVHGVCLRGAARVALARVRVRGSALRGCFVYQNAQARACGLATRIAFRNHERSFVFKTRERRTIDTSAAVITHTRLAITHTRLAITHTRLAATLASQLEMVDCEVSGTRGAAKPAVQASGNVSAVGTPDAEDEGREEEEGAQGSSATERGEAAAGGGDGGPVAASGPKGTSLAERRVAGAGVPSLRLTGCTVRGNAGPCVVVVGRVTHDLDDAANRFDAPPAFVDSLPGDAEEEEEGAGEEAPSASEPPAPMEQPDGGADAADAAVRAAVSRMEIDADGDDRQKSHPRAADVDTVNAPHLPQ